VKSHRFAVVAVVFLFSEIDSFC